MDKLHLNKLLKYGENNVLQLDVIINFIVDYKNDKYDDSYLDTAKMKIIKHIIQDENNSHTVRKVSNLINLFNHYF